MVKIVPEYELDYFDWLVRQRLINFPAMPVKGEEENKNGCSKDLKTKPQ